MIDPRPAVINKRLKNVKNVIVVASGKGGVGKSLISTSLAIAFSKKGYKVGLLDLDMYGPTDHLILGWNGEQPHEEMGILPPEINGISFMSTVFYVGDNPLPIRGNEITDAIIEILTITRWEEKDFLIIDMPPGIGDEVLDVMRFFKDKKFIVVTTPSMLSWEAVKRLIKLLKELDVNILGIIENMKEDNTDLVKIEVSKLGINYLGEIRRDSNLEKHVTNIDKLVETSFFKEIEKIASKIE